MEGLTKFFSQLIFGANQTALPSSPQEIPINKAKTLAPIPLGDLLADPLVDFGPSSIEELNGTVTERLYRDFAERGFAILAIDESDERLSTLLSLRRQSQEFFALNVEDKEKQWEQFAGENRGYILVPKLREYLKLRREDGGTHGGPSSLESLFVESFDYLSEILWRVYIHLYHASRVRFFVNARKGEAEPRPLLSQKDLEETKECILERSYVSIIHYFENGEEVDKETQIDDDEAEKEGGEKEKEREGEEGQETTKRRCVCSTHTDTGILTGILCAEVPALEALDWESNRWVKVEEELKKDEPPSSSVTYLVVIMGEKAPLFTGSKQLRPTKHRVNLLNDEERYSLLFFMDTSKAS